MSWLCVFYLGMITETVVPHSCEDKFNPTFINLNVTCMNIYQSYPRRVAAKITGLRCSVDYETAATHSSDRIDYGLSRNNLYNIVINYA